MTDKVVGLRVFTDAEDKMNLALGDVQGSLLVAVSYTHLRAHETVLDLVCRLLLEKKNTQSHIT